MRWILTLLLFASQLSAATPNTTIRALVACDTTSKNLMGRGNRDMKNICRFLHILSIDTQCPLSLKTLSGNDLCFRNFQKWGKTLPQTSNDIVFIYFSGHGSRPPKVTTPWPYIHLMPAKEFLPIDSFFIGLSNQHHRLVILLFDCCNAQNRKRSTNKKIDALSASVYFSRHGLKKFSKEGLCELYLKSKGVIVAVAASPNEMAYALAQGGLFTNAFLRTMLMMSQEKSASWELAARNIVWLCKNSQKPIIMARKSIKDFISPERLWLAK